MECSELRSLNQTEITHLLEQITQSELSISDIAKAIGAVPTRTTIQSWITGKSIPRRAKAKRVLDFLQKS